VVAAVPAPDLLGVQRIKGVNLRAGDEVGPLSLCGSSSGSGGARNSRGRSSAVPDRKSGRQWLGSSITSPAVSRAELANPLFLDSFPGEGVDDDESNSDAAKESHEGRKCSSGASSVPKAFARYSDIVRTRVSRRRSRQPGALPTRAISDAEEFKDGADCEPGAKRLSETSELYQTLRKFYDARSRRNPVAASQNDGKVDTTVAGRTVPGTSGSSERTYVRWRVDDNGSRLAIWFKITKEIGFSPVMWVMPPRKMRN
jgi:hypothetical protein